MPTNQYVLRRHVCTAYAAFCILTTIWTVSIILTHYTCETNVLHGHQCTKNAATVSSNSWSLCGHIDMSNYTTTNEKKDLRDYEWSQVDHCFKQITTQASTKPLATVSTQQQACCAGSSAFQEYYCKRGDVLDDLRLITAQSRSQHRQAYIQRKLRNMIHLSAIHISRTFPTRLSRL